MTNCQPFASPGKAVAHLDLTDCPIDSVQFSGHASWTLPLPGLPGNAVKYFSAVSGSLLVAEAANGFRNVTRSTTKAVCGFHYDSTNLVLPYCENVFVGSALIASPNLDAQRTWENAASQLSCRVKCHTIDRARVYDFGIDTNGSIAAGLQLARGCLGGGASVSLVPCDSDIFGVSNTVAVTTDVPELACLGCQYAGWPVQTDDYFAMGSGPMRLLRGKEPVLLKRNLSDSQTTVASGVLESDQLPSASAIATIASECGVNASQLTLAVAPSTSIAGTIQVVARCVETAMHQLFERGFDLNAVVSATGDAPLPPIARRGDTIGGIGRTNDAILYGGNVTFWVDCDDSAVEAVFEQITSSASKDYGRPFAKIFADYDHDFYKVDPMLFSPAVVVFHNLRSGNSFIHGTKRSDLIRESFGT